MEGKTRKIGLVLTQIEGEEIRGYLAKVRTSIGIGELFQLVLEQEVVKIYFWCKPSTGEYKTTTQDEKQIKQIEEELQKLGIKELKRIPAKNSKEQQTIPNIEKELESYKKLLKSEIFNKI